MTDDEVHRLRNAIYEVQMGAVEVNAFSVHNTTVDEGLAAAKRLAEAAATITEIVQGAYNASP